MRSITIQVTGRTTKSPAEVSAKVLDTTGWSEFQGYGVIPGIAEAHFEQRTPELVGSTIRVHSKDGSTHVEEIIEWNPDSRIVFRFQEFDSPLKHLASHFVETWYFSAAPGGTQITRQMAMHPRGILGWLVLFPISRMMKQAFEKSQGELPA